MNPSKYEILLKIQETKSFTRTAEYFQYTQSAISQTIKSMENDMNVTLFHRTPSGIFLTDEGKFLLPSILQIVEGHRHLEEQLSQLHKSHIGKVRIGAYDSMSCHWLPPCIKAFNQIYPNITFELYQEDDLPLLDLLKKGAIDLAFISNPKKREYDYVELFKDPFMIILPEKYPITSSTISLNDFKEESFIFLDVGYSKYTKAMFKKAGFKPKVKYRMIDDLTVMSMVEHCFGIGILPKLATHRTPYKLQILTPVEDCYRSIGMVTRKNDHFSWAQKKFMSFASEFHL